MADDEPLDDLRAIAMAGGTAAARVVETLAREARELRQREQDRLAADQAARALHLAQQYGRSPDPTGLELQRNEQRRNDLDRARDWARQENPDRLAAYEQERSYADTPDGRDSAERSLVRSWQGATQPVRDVPDENARWDSHNANRDAREDAMAGVSQEAREARAVADRMNGTDPGGAAASVPASPQASAAPAKVAVRGAVNGR